jgi:hypothetical protein
MVRIAIRIAKINCFGFTVTLPNPINLVANHNIWFQILLIKVVRDSKGGDFLKCALTTLSAVALVLVIAKYYLGWILFPTDNANDMLPGLSDVL